MRSKLLLVALSVAVLAGSVTVASAAQPTKQSGVKATTNDLPAALLAVNPDQNKILSVDQASEIRGEAWGWGWGGGWGGWHGGWGWGGGWHGGWGWGGGWGGHWGHGGWGHHGWRW